MHPRNIRKQRDSPNQRTTKMIIPNILKRSIEFQKYQIQSVYVIKSKCFRLLYARMHVAQSIVTQLNIDDTWYMSDIKIVQRLASMCSCAIVEKKSRLNKNGKWFRKLSYNSIQLTIQLYFIAEHRWDWMHENQSKDVLRSLVIENVNYKDMNRI